MQSVTIRPAVDASKLPSVERLGGDSVAETDDVFPQSVASGGPTPTGVILWTRIAPEQYDPPTALRVEVAADADFEDVILRSELPEPSVKPSDNYTVRVDLAGVLEPNSTYYYRFAYGGVRSRTGRCRTLPARDTELRRLRLGLLNCQNYQNGYFGAMAHLAAADVDFVLHLGDYVYEYADSDEGASGPYRDRTIELPSKSSLPMSLDDFRAIYETYKRDPYLRELHERHTVLQTWDDHAIANDRYWDYDADAPVFPDHPCGTVPQFTRYLTRVGIQAWWEFVPARITYDPDADHLHDSFELYRVRQFGDLVTVLLTDERLYRSRPLSLSESVPGRDRKRDSSRTMLGARQREWFLDELRDSETTWTVWANAVLFGSFTLGRPWLRPSRDSWDGYEVERGDILAVLEERRRANGPNFVTLTGDMHTTLVSRIRSRDGERRRLGVEFMTPGATSVNFAEKIGEVLSRRFGNRRALNRTFPAYLERAMRRLARRLNVDFEFFDSAHWGYSVVTFTPDDCTWEVFWVDKTVNSANAERNLAHEVCIPVEDGPGDEQTTGPGPRERARGRTPRVPRTRV
ncbi:alkaline phosphatase D family protein [Halogeometricum limi]|uniref:Alkaline phosphatase D n=1 Tax=Halogeometricum limi TaxID=555875 RepID=A0A1I6I9R3_9EURY|nr:alkaline phosphatase D family protein [Halogeometricum limi]SFR63378.1 alkaline phosphatase D [Halogeometricum limi]